MTGTKASGLEVYCAGRGQPYVRFDYFGHGQSSGRFEDGCLSRWLDDALAVLDALTDGPQILVGSSMGGWIMLLAALARPDRVAGLVGIAAAPDFTEELIWNRLGKDDRHRLLTNGSITQASDYPPGAMRLTRQLIEDGRRHLLLGGSIAIRCPIRLLHGMADADVPWQTSLRLTQQVKSTDAVLSLVKDGDHRMSRPQDIDRLFAMIDELIGRH
jgi:pimeloyl-ACP methyl ester carboxylesterase